MEDGLPPGWSRTNIDNTILYVHESGITASVGYEPTANGDHKHWVIVQGESAVPSLPEVGALARVLTDGAPMALVPGWTPAGYDAMTWCFLETHDSVLAELWEVTIHSIETHHD